MNPHGTMVVKGVCRGCDLDVEVAAPPGRTTWRGPCPSCGRPDVYASRAPTGREHRTPLHVVAATPPVEPMAGRPAVLYRCFSANGALLYVGQSIRAAERLSQHEAAQPWWPLVARVDLEHFADLAECLGAERTAIKSERPRHNVQHAEPIPELVEYVQLLWSREGDGRA